jgi:hypothetical protein
MSEIAIPKQVADRLERRWASRLARQAAFWHSEKPSPTMAREIQDRKGRLIPVTFKRAPLRGGADTLVNRVL